MSGSEAHHALVPEPGVRPPDDLRKTLEAVDAEGLSINDLGKQSLLMALAKGEVYAILDEPPLAPAADGKVVTLNDRKEHRVKPFPALTSADKMRAFETVTVAGVQSASYACWFESEERQSEIALSRNMSTP
jgi:hypothetical protein